MVEKTECLKKSKICSFVLIQGKMFSVVKLLIKYTVHLLHVLRRRQ